MAACLAIDLGFAHPAGAVNHAGGPGSRLLVSTQSEIDDAEPPDAAAAQIQQQR